MTTATAQKIPTISATSTPNFFDVLSSDGVTHYPMLVEGPRQVRCGCPAGEVGKTCYHRNWVLNNIAYIDPEIEARWSALEAGLQELNQTIQNAIEDAAAREAYETMMTEESEAA